MLGCACFWRLPVHVLVAYLRAENDTCNAFSEPRCTSSAITAFHSLILPQKLQYADTPSLVDPVTFQLHAGLREEQGRSLFAIASLELGVKAMCSTSAIAMPSWDCIPTIVQDDWSSQ